MWLKRVCYSKNSYWQQAFTFQEKPESKQTNLESQTTKTV